MTTHRKRVIVFAALMAVGVLHAGSTPAVAAPLLTETFDNIGTLSGSGWSLINNSAPAGSTNWFQGNPGVFGSQSGAPSSYIASNFNAAGFGGNISNWLLLPTLTLGNGDELSFWTRSNAEFQDRLEVRFSANGGSSNVGGTDSSVGDFTTLFHTVNLLLDGSYPDGWMKYTVVLSGLSGPTSGRLAFRYAVPDTSVNGDYIGIDSVEVNAAVPEPATLTLLGLGLAGLAAQRRRRSATAVRAHAQKGA
jgi:hypothetical protein